MKLETVKRRHFVGYKSETHIPVSDLTAFIGKNEAGKSTVIEAFEIFFNNSFITCELRAIAQYDKEIVE